MAAPRLSDLLASEKDRRLAETVASTAMPMFWQRRRRERLRVHVLDAIVHSKLDATESPYTPWELFEATRLWLPERRPR